MPLVLIAAPTAEPVSVSEAKLHCRIDGTEFDTVLPIYIASARKAAEHILGRALVSQTWELRIDEFPAGDIELLKPPVSAVVSIKYDDPSGAEQTVSGASYSLDTAAMPPVVRLAVGAEWPGTQDKANAVRVRFTAGYGASGANVPADVRHWMLLQIATAVDQTEAFARGFSVADLPNRWADGLLDGEKTYL